MITAADNRRQPPPVEIVSQTRVDLGTASCEDSTTLSYSRSNIFPPDSNNWSWAGINHPSGNNPQTNKLIRCRDSVLLNMYTLYFDSLVQSDEVCIILIWNLGDGATLIYPLKLKSLVELVEFIKSSLLVPFSPCITRKTLKRRN